MTKQSNPWNDYPRDAGFIGWDHKWDHANFPFVVRWSVSSSERNVYWRTFSRNFRTLEEAVEAYKRPFAGIDVDLVMYNGKPPGQHLDTLASRKCRKPTKWADAVPMELRG